MNILCINLQMLCYERTQMKMSKQNVIIILDVIETFRWSEFQMYKTHND